MFDLCKSGQRRIEGQIDISSLESQEASIGIRNCFEKYFFHLCFLTPIRFIPFHYDILVLLVSFELKRARTDNFILLIGLGLNDNHVRMGHQIGQKWEGSQCFNFHDVAAYCPEGIATDDVDQSTFEKTFGLVQYPGKGKNGILGLEFFAIVELNTFPEIEAPSKGIHPLPGNDQARLQFQSLVQKQERFIDICFLPRTPVKVGSNIMPVHRDY